jgi:TRAP-type C4-dicarboxylate transport system permease small subunit
MSAVLRIVRSARVAVVTAAAWVAGIFFGIIFAINVLQIVLRQFDAGLIWVSDLSRLLFTWTVMLGAAAAYGLREHIVASFIVEKVPARWQWVPALAVRIVETLIALILLFAGLAVTANRMQIDYIQLEGVSTGWAYLSVPVLGAVMLLCAFTLPLKPETTDEQVERELAAITGINMQEQEAVR